MIGAAFTISIISWGFFLHTGQEVKLNAVEFENPFSALDLMKHFQTPDAFLTYHSPIKPFITGKTFHDVNKTILKDLIPEPVELQETNVDDFLFVTAASGNFVGRLTLLVESIQKYFPSKKLIVYDLGGITKELLNNVSITDIFI